MTKLHTVLALRDGVQSRKHEALSEAHKHSQKAPLYAGLSRTYRPKDEDGDSLPAESTHVQLNAQTVLRELVDVLSRFWDVTATVDATNQAARADVVVTTDGEQRTLLANVPGTHLLFLEKQLDDVHTFVKKLPTLDPSEQWHFDAGVDCYATAPTESARTKKTPRNHVKAEATDRHPAQVDVYTEDVIVGYWRQVKFSGALPAARRRELLERVDALRYAVREARERANETEVVPLKVAQRIFDFILAE